MATGIITCVPGESSIKDNPVIACLDRLKEFDSVSIDGPLRDEDFDEISSLFNILNELCSSQESGNAAIAIKHGAVDLTCSICSKIKTSTRSNRVVVPCFKALAVLIRGKISVLELVFLVCLTLICLDHVFIQL